MTSSDPPTQVPCPNCGFAIPIGATWCPGCAKRQQVQSDQVRHAKNQRALNLIVLILAIVVGTPLAVCGGCILTYAIADAASNPLFVLNTGYGLAVVAIGGLLGYAFIKWRSK